MWMELFNQLINEKKKMKKDIETDLISVIVPIFNVEASSPPMHRKHIGINLYNLANHISE